LENRIFRTQTRSPEAVAEFPKPKLLASPLILVVEDEARISEALEQYLHRTNFGAKPAKHRHSLAHV
jgi:PleD family two-component response regulator